MSVSVGSLMRYPNANAPMSLPTWLLVTLGVPEFSRVTPSNKGCEQMYVFVRGLPGAKLTVTGRR